LEQESAEAYARIHEMLELLDANPGGGRRMAAVVADLSEALRDYPRTRYQSLLLRRVAIVFTTIRGNLSDQARELTVCRNRLIDLGRAFEPANNPSSRSPTQALNLVPAGCRTFEEAVTEFLSSVEPEALRDLDQQIQRAINQTYGSLLQVCLTSGNVVKSLEELMMQKVMPELAGRLTDMNVVEMFLGQYGEDDAAVAEIANAYNEAIPELARKSSPSEPEIRVLALPPGEAADHFRGLLRKALVNVPLMIADSADDVVFYREQAGLTMERLDILGQVGQNAYRQMAGADNFSPHSREDIPDWTPPMPRE
jgi:eukaryotic-like serine/threonine-protein kinase